MGGWKLEVFRMGLYIFFPVSMFALFNNDAFAAHSIKEARLIINRAVNNEAVAALEKAEEDASKALRHEQLKKIKAGTL